LALIGLISDTHGLLRPEAIEAFRGAEMIVHAGDIGTESVLKALREIAPVVAVRGNVDKAPWCSPLPTSAVVETPLGPMYVLHDLSQLDLDPKAAGFVFVVSGHSHKAQHEDRDGVVYINPGSAGPRRFKLPVTVARLQVRADDYELEFIELKVSTSR
jgi:putative phosphoesterase